MIVFHGSLLNYLQDGSTIQSHYISNPLQPFLPFRLSSDPMCLAGSPRPLSAAFYSTRTALRPSIGHLIAVCRIVRRRRAVARRSDGGRNERVCSLLAGFGQFGSGGRGGSGGNMVSTLYARVPYIFILADHCATKDNKN